MRNLISNLIRDENGAAGVEYALLVAIVAVAIAASAAALSTSVSTAFANIKSNW
jgi:pilus assembly protein Flp/PilA